MADIFLSYAREDAAAAHALAGALSSLNYEVFWDRNLSPGDDFRARLQAELAAARCVIVLWSKHSVESNWVLAEVQDAWERGKLVPARIQTVDIPFPYGSIHTAVLTNWEYGANDAALDCLIGAVGQVVERKPDGPDTDVGVPTPTAFIGATERGPVLEPHLISNWAEFEGIYGAGLNPEVSYLSLAVRGYFENGGTLAAVVRIVGDGCSEATVSLASHNHAPPLSVRARGCGSWGNQVSLTVSNPGARDPANPAQPDPARFRLAVRYNGGVTEVHDNVSLDQHSPDYVAARLGLSNLVRADVSQPIKAPPHYTGEVYLAGGSDGVLTVADYVEGIRSLEALDLVQLVVVPDHAHTTLVPSERTAITKALLAHCMENSRFAILATEPGIDDPESVHPPAVSRFGAAYYPWVLVEPDGALIPPIGHIAGAYARADAECGVHCPPDGLEVRGIASGGVGFDLSDEAREDLLARGVNVLCRQAGKAVRTAGARTMSFDTGTTSVATIRLFLFVRNSIQAGMGWLAFERNEPNTWDRLKREVGVLLEGVWRDGALMGETPEEAFFVKCGLGETMTQYDVDNDRIILVVGISPVDGDGSAGLDPFVLRTGGRSW